MKKVHFIGIGGSGMSAVAGIAQALGYEVSGCETIQESKHNALTLELEKRGVAISFEADPSHLKDIDILCVSAAVYDLPNEHSEITYAKQHGIPVMQWQEFMGSELQKDKKVIAIAGTKGKSTTTAYTGFILEQAGLDPTVMVGATVVNWGSNYRIGKSDYFVCEADEFNNNFLHYNPNITVITNIEMEHPEFFHSYDEYLESYVNLVKRMPDDGILILNADSPGVRDLHDRLSFFKGKRIFLGENQFGDEENTLLLGTYNAEEKWFAVHTFSVFADTYHDFPLIGLHNVMNCLSALAVGYALGLEEKDMIKGVSKFKGTGRRLELKYDDEIRVYNDYAHTATSVKVTLDALRETYPSRRIIAIFQPHLYSRVKMQLTEFADAFESADYSYLVDIYGSRESDKPISKEVSSEMIVNAVKQKHPRAGIEYIGDKSEAAKYVVDQLQSGDVVVNMGAGDNGIIAEEICKILKAKH